MNCRGIKTNRAGMITGLCSNNCVESSKFCVEHQDTTSEVHKSLWIRMFLWGADGKPFRYGYDERKRDRILTDLQDGTVELTNVDIVNIPSNSRFLDIYVLLVELGYSVAKMNIGLYSDSCRYLGQFMYPMKNTLTAPYSPLARKILEHLILKDEEHLRAFLNEFIRLLKFYPEFQGESLTNRIVSVTFFLSSLLDSEAARKISWEKNIQSIVDLFDTRLGAEHPITSYVKDVMVYEFYQLYKEEKERQKCMLDPLKEELMAMTWHSDRFQEWCLDEEEKAENRMLFA